MSKSVLPSGEEINTTPLEILRYLDADGIRQMLRQERLRWHLKTNKDVDYYDNTRLFKFSGAMHNEGYYQRMEIRTFPDNGASPGYAGIYVDSGVSGIVHNLDKWSLAISDESKEAIVNRVIIGAMATIDGLKGFGLDDDGNMSASTSNRSAMMLFDPFDGRIYLMTNDDPTYMNNETRSDPLPARTAARIGDIPTRVTQLVNDINFITDPDYKHTDNNFTHSNRFILDNIDDRTFVYPEISKDADGEYIKNIRYGLNGEAVYGESDTGTQKNTQPDIGGTRGSEAVSSYNHNTDYSGLNTPDGFLQGVFRSVEELEKVDLVHQKMVPADNRNPGARRPNVYYILDGVWSSNWFDQIEYKDSYLASSINPSNMEIHVDGTEPWPYKEVDNTPLMGTGEFSIQNKDLNLDYIDGVGVPDLVINPDGNLVLNPQDQTIDDELSNINAYVSNEYLIMESKNGFDKSKLYQWRYNRVDVSYPSSKITITIVESGSGYHVGDILRWSFGDESFMYIVDAVGANGQILQGTYKIERNVEYDHDPSTHGVGIEFTNTTSTGSGAKLAINSEASIECHATQIKNNLYAYVDVTPTVASDNTSLWSDNKETDSMGGLIGVRSTAAGPAFSGINSGRGGDVPSPNQSGFMLNEHGGNATAGAHVHLFRYVINTTNPTWEIVDGVQVFTGKWVDQGPLGLERPADIKALLFSNFDTNNFNNYYKFMMDLLIDSMNRNPDGVYTNNKNALSPAYIHIDQVDPNDDTKFTEYQIDPNTSKVIEVDVTQRVIYINQATGQWFTYNGSYKNDPTYGYGYRGPGWVPVAGAISK